MFVTTVSMRAFWTNACKQSVDVSKSNEEYSQYRWSLTYGWECLRAEYLLRAARVWCTLQSRSDYDDQSTIDHRNKQANWNPGECRHDWENWLTKIWLQMLLRRLEYRNLGSTTPISSNQKTKTDNRWENLPWLRIRPPAPQGVSQIVWRRPIYYQERCSSLRHLKCTAARTIWRRWDWQDGIEWFRQVEQGHCWWKDSVDDGQDSPPDLRRTTVASRDPPITRHRTLLPDFRSWSSSSWTRKRKALKDWEVGHHCVWKGRLRYLLTPAHWESPSSREAALGRRNLSSNDEGLEIPRSHSR